MLEDLGARFAGNPMDVWFRLGEIYERRLNDPAKAQGGLREGAAGLAALRRRAAEAD